MTLQTNNRIIRNGFILTYSGGMGTLAAFGFDAGGAIATNLIFIPAAAIGIGMIAIAKISSGQQKAH